MTYQWPELNEQEFEIADKIEIFLKSAPYWMTPSNIARHVKTDTQTARTVLAYMAERRYILADGNGSRVRYRTR
jgi:DNA-binding IclR family transcriptional regulator